MAFGSRISRMSDMAVTLLPEPDSPTMPSTLPARMVNETPSTARTIPSSVRNETCRSRTSRSGSSGNAHPRIEEAVEDVDHGVGHHDEEGRVHGGRHDDGQVEVLEGVIGQLADARKAEDDLRQERAAGDQRREIEAEEADERDHRRAQDVPAQHAALRQALRARRAHEILALRVDQARAQHAPV